MSLNKFFLLADDDHDDAELFNEALSTVNSSIKFHHVEDGQEVFQLLAKLGNEKPDIIFLDLNMPAMSGWQCLAKLKNDPLLKNIPVIMYSTSSNPREKEIAIELGATGFVTKPTDFKVLTTILETISTNLNADLRRILKEI
jgi:CheY-like chemotaxis protein